MEIKNRIKEIWDELQNMKYDPENIDEQLARREALYKELDELEGQ